MNNLISPLVAAALLAMTAVPSIAAAEAAFVQPPNLPRAADGAPGWSPYRGRTTAAPVAPRGNTVVPRNFYFERGTGVQAFGNERSIGTWRASPPAPRVGSGYHGPRYGLLPSRGDRYGRGARHGVEPDTVPGARADLSAHPVRAGTPARVHSPTGNPEAESRLPRRPVNVIHRIDPTAPHAARDSSGVSFGFGPIPRTAPIRNPQVPYAGSVVQRPEGIEPVGPAVGPRSRPGYRSAFPGRAAMTAIVPVTFATVPDFIIEPLRGQSTSRLLDDREDCIESASADSGFDPAFIDGGLREPHIARGQAAFNDAFAGCLIAQGYDLR